MRFFMGVHVAVLEKLCLKIVHYYIDLNKMAKSLTRKEKLDMLVIIIQRMSD